MMMRAPRAGDLSAKPLNAKIWPSAATLCCPRIDRSVNLQLVYSKAPRQVAISEANLSLASAGSTPSLGAIGLEDTVQIGNLTVRAIARILRGSTASYLRTRKYGKLDGVASLVGGLALEQ